MGRVGLALADLVQLNWIGIEQSWLVNRCRRWKVSWFGELSRGDSRPVEKIVGGGKFVGKHKEFVFGLVGVGDYSHLGNLKYVERMMMVSVADVEEWKVVEVHGRLGRPRSRLILSSQDLAGAERRFEYDCNDDWGERCVQVGRLDGRNSPLVRMEWVREASGEWELVEMGVAEVGVETGEPKSIRIKPYKTRNVQTGPDTSKKWSAGFWVFDDEGGWRLPNDEEEGQVRMSVCNRGVTEIFVTGINAGLALMLPKDCLPLKESDRNG